jgi:hypothetical protein
MDCRATGGQKEAVSIKCMSKHSLPVRPLPVVKAPEVVREILMTECCK